MGNIIALFRERVIQFGDKPALFYKDESDKYCPLSYQELFSLATRFGSGLSGLGVKRGDHIGLISDNKKEWLIANFGILGIGAIDVPRGSDSTEDEIQYILSHADCATAVVENQVQLERVVSLKNKLPLLRTVITLEDVLTTKPVQALAFHLFSGVIAKGESVLAKNPDFFNSELEKGKDDELATLIYTSGTTGEPKGVMLTHRNFHHQISAPLKHLDIGPTDVFLSVLPIWHAFERSVELVALFSGCSVAYSKLVGKILLADMEAINPTIFPSVPRIWESVRGSVYKKVSADGGIREALFHFFVGIGGLHVYLRNMYKGLLPQFRKRYRILDILLSLIPLLLIKPLNFLGQILVFGKIKEKLGKRFKFGVSGAGALPPHVDNFFSACGVLVVEGYGLTEAAPICAVRLDRAPVPNTIGPPLPEMEVKILDPEGRQLKPGEKGVLYVRGPNVMKGYYKRPEETAKVLAPDGWLNTGDLAIMTFKGELAIRGRVKETIVLLGGENVEPGPIEDVILQSEYIDQVIVVGQDKKYLAAMVVPKFEALEEYAKKHKVGINERRDEFIALPEIMELIKGEISSRVNTGKGFKVFERIFKFRILSEIFEPGRELTHSLKLRRNVITEMYKKQIEELYR